MVIDNPHSLSRCPRCGGNLEFFWWFYMGERIDDVRCLMCSEYFFSP